jgi:hypothetical protein
VDETSAEFIVGVSNALELFPSEPALLYGAAAGGGREK